MDCIVHVVSKSQTWLSDFHFHFKVKFNRRKESEKEEEEEERMDLFPPAPAYALGLTVIGLIWDDWTNRWAREWREITQ